MRLLLLSTYPRPKKDRDDLTRIICQASTGGVYFPMSPSHPRGWLMAECMKGGQREQDVMGEKAG